MVKAIDHCCTRVEDACSMISNAYHLAGIFDRRNEFGHAIASNSNFDHQWTPSALPYLAFRLHSISRYSASFRRARQRIIGL